MSEKPKIVGVGAVITDSQGVVQAHAFDFERQGYGGFRLWEAQRIRAKRSAIAKFMDSYIYGDLRGTIEEYDADRMASKLRNEKKLRITFVSVGHELTEAEVNS